MWNVLYTHTLLCHRHPPLGTGMQPLALEMLERHKPLTFLLLGCLPLFFSPFLDIFCTSQLICQLCHLLQVSKGSVSLCFLSATSHELNLVHVGLCNGVRSRRELGAVPLGLLPSLLHPPFCLCPVALLQCMILIYRSHLHLSKISIVSKGHLV